MKWFRKSAEQGHGKAQSNLGTMYYKGEGVPPDYAEAALWYRKAANQGYAKAQNNLGFMYSKGQGVSQDHVQAHMWLDLAVSRSPLGRQYDSAVKKRDVAAKNMTPAQIAEAQRLAREWMAKFQEARKANLK